VNVTRTIARFLEREKRAPFGVSLDPIRAIDLPQGVRVIGVGGATLGGSYRTPVAIALAAALEDCALVMHGAGARVSRARIVERDDDVRAVGDEALIAARALERRVIVAPTRIEALSFAARVARTIVVDRLLQTRPVRLARSLLAVDARAPFGAGVTLPFGDLLARRESLLSACDEVVAIDAAHERFSLPAIPARVGVVATLARPERMRRALAALGVDPVVFLERADHAPVSDRERRMIDRIATRERLDGLVVDNKSAALGIEGFLLDHRVVLDPSVIARAAC